ncbi:MAG: V-type ATP synthase subunit A [Desulfurivibrionaceae bacterium]|nr:V-type ATP synthase subunit A [Desulfobulbales bacterium]MDT8334067.1 V-type ATP synthase subunit A [Desulfurivibrionaceae bacterium]
MPNSSTEAWVTGVKGNIVTMEFASGSLMKNEVAYVRAGEARLKAEVLRIRGKRADMQVFEDTAGIKAGDPVELSGELLSVTLGPGLLGRIYDGLQNPLEVMASRHGFFLPRGVQVEPLDAVHKWSFVPAVRAGDRLQAGGVLGTVQEGRYTHKIMVPFARKGEVEVTWIQGGSFTVLDPVARISHGSGEEDLVTLRQRWPVRRPLPEYLLYQGLAERLFPSEPLLSTIRIVDTFFPVARGGTACIPGPFGAGKTVVQGLIARYSMADIVIVVACGERAGEVVEMIEDFSRMKDPRGGGSLMERTVIICNTSSMPVAAREASIYTGITLGEYYRQMGHQTLLLADSTSRWAQAMRETSGNLEEIPGEEAYPAYLDSNIKEVYERAGVIRAGDKAVGSLTMIGTVSPAGGNFEEPVTQSTLATVKAFLGLSSERAYQRFYPAVDPLISWSRYLEQLRPHLDQNLHEGWTDMVHEVMELLKRGDGINRMMQVTGEEGISLDDFVIYQKATFVDMVYLQQDAFDEVDVSTSTERQRENFLRLKRLIDYDYDFKDKEEARDFFTRLTGLFKNLNYSVRGSHDYRKYARELDELAGTAT